MSQTCQECGAKCCKYFCFEIDKPTTYDEFEDARWFLCHAGVSIHIDEGDWFISILNRCDKLADDDQCTAYEDRPLICRKYDPNNCDHTQGDYGYDELFESPEALDQYARKTLGKNAYERAKARKRAKLEPKPAKAKGGKPKKKSKKKKQKAG